MFLGILQPNLTPIAVGGAPPKSRLRLPKPVGVSSFLARLLQPKRLIWIELEALRGQFVHGFPNLEGGDLSPHFIDRRAGLAD